MARLPPALQRRWLSSQGAPGDWIGVVQPSPRRWWHLLFNPAGTQTLAAQTLVERWYLELVELGEAAPACRESLTLVTALAESALVQADAAEGDGWQLRLVVIDEADGTTDVVYESDRIVWDVAPASR